MSLESIVVFVVVVGVGLREKALVGSQNTFGGSSTIAAESSHLTRADGMVQLLEALLVCGVVLVEVEVFPFVLTSALFAWVV